MAIFRCRNVQRRTGLCLLKGLSENLLLLGPEQLFGLLKTPLFEIESSQIVAGGAPNSRVLAGFLKELGGPGELSFPVSQVALIHQPIGIGAASERREKETSQESTTINRNITTNQK